MSETTFDLHEDDWGMIALEPRENLAQRLRTIAEATAHADAHRTPGGFYDAMYIAPAPEVDLAIRHLTLDALAARLGPAWQRYDRVASGYSSYREEVTDAFAFHLAQFPEVLLDGSTAPVFYGTIDKGIVTSLNVHHPSDAIADELDGKATKRRREAAVGRPIAGTRLIREWRGKEHCVTVRRDDFEYQGRPYKSLSAVARHITGTNWNGLVFFGLKNQGRRS